MKGYSIIAENISVRLGGKKLLDGISFSLAAGEHLLLCGDSGSGKTLLTKAITGEIFHNGLVRLSTGEKNIHPAVRRVEQHYHFTNRSHLQQFYYQQRFNSMDADDAATVMDELLEVQPQAQRVRELLGIFGLTERAGSPLLHLSSGEHKRFQLVRAFLQAPCLLILDEPFTGMDKRSREMLRSFLAAEAAGGWQFILICDPDDCPGFITKAARLGGGRLEYFGALPALEQEQHSANLFRASGLSNRSLPLSPLPASFSNIIEISNGNITHGQKKLLEGVNWQVKNGERWWLKGDNGSGKSTLLSLVTGDNPKAYANDIALFGKKRGTGESIWDIKKNIGFVSPELQWYFDNSQTCYNAVASGLFDTIGLFRRLEEKQHLRVQAFLEAFGLSALANRLLSMLSTSQQRLALLARAMIKNPHLLVLDEPCQGLDEKQREYFTGLVDLFCEDPNRSLVYVTHYEEELPACIDRKLELSGGMAIAGQFRSEKLLTA